MRNDEKLIVEELARRVAETGGRAYYVGGYVRDSVMGVVSNDIDIEVYGIQGDRLLAVLQDVGHVETKGAGYGIMTLSDWDIDVALPRTEVRTGTGHRDFEVTTDPFLTPEMACRRRDFTVNAMLMDVLTGDIVDPYGGLDDIRRKSIRHIDAGIFAEDPLRVLRACQFAARLGYSVTQKTVKLCRSMDISTLPGFRVADEMRKALLFSDRPSIFFEYLLEMGQLGCWFPELRKLVGLVQDPVYHPEGDVWAHTMQVVNRAAGKRDMSSDGYLFMLLALTHDFGKILTTERINDRIHSYRHETEGLPLILSFLERLGYDKRTQRYILNMVPLHMHPGMMVKDRSSMKATNTMFDAAESPEDLMLFYSADHGPDSEGEKFLKERYEAYLMTMSRPYVTGEDLIKAGVKPSADFKRRLDLAHKLRLAGVDKQQALKQVISEKI